MNAPLSTTRPAATSGPKDNSPLLNVPLGSLVTQAPVTVSPDTPVQSVAQTMRSHGVSSVFLVHEGELTGLITDRDLRNRVLADNLPPDTPARQVATLTPRTLQHDQPAFAAMLLMARYNVHHMPVLDGKRIVGMVTSTDLSRHHSSSAVFIASDIHAQTDLDGLVAVSQRIRALQMSLSAAHTSAYDTGHIVSTITDALTERLIQLAVQRLGPAPVAYVWVAAGSQGRMEQTAKSDQDNCMILSDDFDAEQHGPYFQQFARWVCDGLAACGFIHCPGEMMAMTDRWRQPLATWRAYFRHWIGVPNGESLLLTTVFFDMRAVHGEQALLDDLRAEVLQSTRGNSLFLAHIVKNCQSTRPPLGWWGQITPERQGPHAGSVNLKYSGIAPIVDLARIYALSAGLAPVNTHDGLALAGQSPEVSAPAALDLQGLLAFISDLRLRQQSAQLHAGQEADHFLPLAGLSRFEKGQLKSAFGLIRDLQSALAHRYQF